MKQLKNSKKSDEDNTIVSQIRKLAPLFAVFLFISIVGIIYLNRQNLTKKDSTNAATNTVQVLRQAAYSEDGTKSWARDCIIDSAAGPNINKCTQWNGPFDLSTLRGVGGESYGSFSAFIFSKNGVQTLRQTVYNRNPIVQNGVTYNAGQASFKRDCTVGPSGLNFDASSCEPWSALGDNRSVRSGVPGTNEAYSGFSSFIIFKNNLQYLRQSFIDANFITAYSRDCEVNAAGPDFSPGKCTWNPNGDLRTAVPQNPNGIYSSVSGTTFTWNGQKYFRQVLVTGDGKNSFFRVCAANDIIGIDFNNCNGGFQANQHPQTPMLGANHIDTFGAYEEFVYTVTSQTSPKPNVVVFLMDDLDVKTTNMALGMGLMPKLQDYIIKKGVNFSNSFVANSNCCPSRATYLTGQYSHNHTVYTNEKTSHGGSEVFNDTATTGVWLHNSGYKTGYIGKYLNEYGYYSDSNHNGVANTIEDAQYVPPGWDDWQGLSDPWVYRMFGFRLNENRLYNEYNVSDPTLYQTDVLATHASSFIDTSTLTGAPFFLTIAPAVPHIEAPENSLTKYTDMFAATVRPAPRHAGGNRINAILQTPAPGVISSFNEADVSDKPNWVKVHPELTATDLANLQNQFNDRVNALRAIDEMIGKTVDTLSRNNMLDRTTLIFTSDNGFMSGEHRLTNKMNPYEESIRVPLYIAMPGGAQGAVTSQIAVNTDLAPTITALAGASPSIDMDGRSLIPLLQNPNLSTWRKKFLLEHYVSGTGSNIPVYDLPTFFGVRTGASQAAPGMTYAEFSTGEKELYNNTTDPQQLASLQSDPSQQYFMGVLSQWLSQLKTCRGASCRAAEDADPAAVNQAPVGTFESAANGLVTGWAKDYDTQNPVIIHFYVNGQAGAGGEFVGQVTANNPRSELPFQDKNHGFSYTLPLPDKFRDGIAHPVYAYALDSSGNGPNPLLTGSPRSFTLAAPIPVPSPPKSVSITCNTAGTAASITWPTVSGATYYNLRVNNTNFPWTCPVASNNPYDVCSGNLTSNLYSLNPVQPGATYSVWVHAGNSTGGSPATATTFKCLAPTPSPSPTPTKSPSPSPTRSPSASPTRSPSPTPTPIAGDFGCNNQSFYTVTNFTYSYAKDCLSVPRLMYLNDARFTNFFTPSEIANIPFIKTDNIVPKEDRNLNWSVNLTYPSTVYVFYRKIPGQVAPSWLQTRFTKVTNDDYSNLQQFLLRKNDQGLIGVYDIYKTVPLFAYDQNGTGRGGVTLGPASDNTVTAFSMYLVGVKPLPYR